MLRPPTGARLQATPARGTARGRRGYGTEFAQVAADVARRCGIEHLVSLNNGAASDYETGLAWAEDAFETAALDITDTWMILYTSGTTGRPKGARITYGMALFNAVHATSSVALGVDSTNLVFLPTFHAAGLHLYANPIFQLGATNVVLRTFDPGRFLALLASKGIRITHLLGVPTNFLIMAQQPGFAEADLSHIVSIGVGGAAAPLALLETYAAKGVALQQLWGMTETGPLGLVLPGDEALRKVGSSGLPVQYARLKVCDEYGVVVEQGTTGELLIKGPAVTPGYWNRTETNTEAFTDGGWFRTGDAARQDEDGFYYIVDRWKDMFISGGENVYPVEVENVIYQLDGVLETAVVAIAHEMWGEVGRAFVVAKPGACWTSTASSRTAARISPVTRFHERCDSSTSCLTMRPGRSSSTDCRATESPASCGAFHYRTSAASSAPSSSVPRSRGLNRTQSFGTGGEPPSGGEPSRARIRHPRNPMPRCAQMWMGPGSSPRFSICLTVGASDSARTVRASLSTLARLMLR